MPPAIPPSPWQRRIQRANELSRQYRFAAEILGFYIHLAGFQEELYRRLSTDSPPASFGYDLSPATLLKLSAEFESFLSMAEEHGPEQLSSISRELRERGPQFGRDRLGSTWTSSSPCDAPGFLAFAFLQPYAELLRSRAVPQSVLRTYAICPLCNRKPVVGVLRQMGDGAARSLVCSFCANEWEFRRMICPACGEENDEKLSVFTAADFDHIRIECCDSCKTYIKTVDLTKGGHAEPLIDELASAPLDLWAHDRHFAKLQPNLMGM
jgi:Protein involved in formate dehydrogenase formation